MTTTKKEEDDTTRKQPDLGSSSNSRTTSSSPTPTTTTTIPSPFATIPPPSSKSPSQPNSSSPLQKLQQTRLYKFLSWTPPRCRFDPDKPPQFSMALNVLFGFAGCFTVANLYYSHPILNLLAVDFGVDEESVSQVCSYQHS